MSFDPMSGPPQRPRSTPIPDPDHPGQALPPPTPAQFLGEQPLPWTPLPGQNVNAPFTAGGAIPGIEFGGSVRPSNGRVLLVTVILLISVGAGIAVFVATRAVTNRAEQAISQVSVFRGDNPPIAPVTLPEGEPSVLLPPTSATVSPDSILPLDSVAGSTLPTPPTIQPVATEPAPPPTEFPGGATSVYDTAATRAVTDQLDLGLAGEPTQFTQIVLARDQAVATAEDPTQPDRLIGAYWIGGSVQAATITSSGGGDLGPLLFTGGEVNWEAIGGLVAGAPALLNLADGQVTSVVVQRVGFGQTPPIVIDVYVQGAGGQGYVEAAADGTILGTH